MGGGASVVQDVVTEEGGEVCSPNFVKGIVGTKPKEQGLPPSLGGKSPSPSAKRKEKYGDLEVHRGGAGAGTGIGIGTGKGTSGNSRESFGDTPVVHRNSGDSGNGNGNGGGGGKGNPTKAAKKSKTLKELEAEERDRKRLISSTSYSGPSSYGGAAAAPPPSSSTSQARKAQLEANATSHWFRILAHSRAKSGSDKFTYRCRMCASENPDALCRVCGSSDDPFRIKWNQRTLKYDNLSLDTNDKESNGHKDDLGSNGVTVSRRAMGLLRRDDRDEDEGTGVVGGGSDDEYYNDDDEAFKSAAAAYAASISNNESTSEVEKRQLAEALLQSLQSYDESKVLSPSAATPAIEGSGIGALDKLTSHSDIHTLSEDSLRIGLPDLLIALKSRTVDSITVVWDMDRHAAEGLALMINDKNQPAVCRYHAVYRVYVDMKNESLNRTGSGILKENKVKDKRDWKLLCHSTTSREETAKGLLPNTKYEFKCRRLRWGGWCKRVIIRSGPGPPSRPQSLVAKEITSNSIIITWAMPEKDNGLPILDYTLSMKSYKQDSELRQVYRGKERLYLVTDLLPNMVYIFTAKANNKAGGGEQSEKYAVRTLPEGAAASTPWVECIDENTGKLFYNHQKSSAISWTLPKGALIDDYGSFKNKKNWLSNQIAHRRDDVKINMGLQDSNGNILFHAVKLDVDRNNLMERSLALLHRLASSDMIAGPIRVTFVGEEGLDAGGLAKDWFQDLMRKIIEGTAGLLKATESGVQIDTRASEIHGSDARWLFRSLGVLIAKAMVDNQILGVSFSPLFLNALKGETITLEDLKLGDPEFYNGLKWIEQNDVTSAELSFNVSYEGMFGESITVPLGDVDENEKLTEENKDRYIELMLKWLSETRFEPCLSHLKDGFYSLMRNGDLKHFRVDEIQMLLGGKAEIDIHELKNTARYNGGYENDSSAIRWFWEIIEEADQELLQQLLTFTTGCSFVPIDGLNPPFTIVKSLDGQIAANSRGGECNQKSLNSILPTAHTCFNQLVLPPYTSFDALKERLEYALENAGSGFHMQ